MKQYPTLKSNPQGQYFQKKKYKMATNMYVSSPPILCYLSTVSWDFPWYSQYMGLIIQVSCIAFLQETHCSAHSLSETLVLIYSPHWDALWPPLMLLLSLGLAKHSLHLRVAPERRGTDPCTGRDPCTGSPESQGFISSEKWFNN